MSVHPTIVLGAGVAGVLSAYHLARKGADVLVVERAPAAAMECSHANAGIVAQGHAQAWGSPSAPLELIGGLMGRHPALKVSRFVDPPLWRWGLAFLGQCSARAHRENSARLLRASEYGATLLKDIGEQEHLEYHRSDPGVLYIFREVRPFQERVRAIRSDASAVGSFEVLAPRDVIDKEPTLAGLERELAGGLLSTKDFSGDCERFTVALAARLEASGRVGFSYGTELTGIRHRGRSVTAVRTGEGDIPCAGLVVAAGCASRSVLKHVGLAPLIYPVKGYSATYEVLDAGRVPGMAAIDETNFMAFSLHGNRLRLTGVAEFAGESRTLPPARLQRLDEYARTLWGDGLDFQHPDYWCGLRPSTPSSTPYVGRISAYDNLWINAGHGHLGWTMAAGCGAVVADLVCGSVPGVSAISASAKWLEPF